MKIDVTQEHINKGQRGDSFSCPVALALLDEGFIRPSIGSVFIEELGYTLTRKGFIVRTPHVASRFTRNFDRGDEVKSFSFELETPSRG